MARRRASTRAAASWVALAAVVLLLPRGSSAGEGDAEELAALAATKARLEKSSFPAEPGAAPPSHVSAAPKPHTDKKASRSTPQQRLAIAILTLKSAFVEPNVKSNDAVCNPDDAPDPCHYVLTTDDCESTDQRINYLRLHYCEVVAKHRSEPLAIIALLLWMMLVFAALTLSADQFFAPAVGNFAAWLRMSDDVAGATLLAFGNGAPDFFTQVAAITHGKSVDLPLALGEGVGAGMYVSCFCLAVGILVSQSGGGVTVPTAPFVRDVIGYLGGFVIFFIAAMDRTINTVESLLFILWYILYVCVVLFGGRYVPALATRFVDHTHGAATAGAGPGSGVGGGSGGGFDVEMAVMPSASEHRDGTGAAVAGGGAGTAAAAARGGATDGELIDARMKQSAEQRLALSTSVKRSTRAAADHDHDSGDEAPERGPGRSVGAASSSGTETMLSEPGGATGGEELGSYWNQLRTWFITYSGIRDPHAVRFLLPFTAPVRLCLSLTMADPGEGTASPVHLALIAFCGPPFLLFTAGHNVFRVSDPQTWILMVLRLGLVIAALSLLPPRGVHAANSMMVSAIAFTGGVAWMDVCADEIVSIFQALGRILGLPESLLGATIMCWAASMGDLVAMIAVVKRGMPNMAVTSCFAGPVFQLLCGLGFSLLFINIGRKEEVPIVLGGNLRLLFAFAVGMMTYYLICVPVVHKSVLSRRFAIGVLVAYTAFVALYTFIGLHAFKQ